MEVNQRNLHHANLLIGSQEDGESYLRSLCESLGVELKNNPDFFVFRTETFGIDEARELKSIAVRKALTGRKIFLIVPTLMTLEAQNALLKTFEEPFPDTYFFLVVREEESVLRTLRSRMNAIAVSGVTDSRDEAENFLKLSLKERIVFAEVFAIRKNNLSLFLDNLMLNLREKGGGDKLVEKIYKIRRLLLDSTSASRLVLEHLALVL